MTITEFSRDYLGVNFKHRRTTGETRCFRGVFARFLTKIVFFPTKHRRTSGKSPWRRPCTSFFWIELIVCKRLRWFSLLFTIITILISISRDIDNIFHALFLYVERLFLSLRARCKLRRLKLTLESDYRKLQIIRRASMIESFRHRFWI